MTGLARLITALAGERANGDGHPAGGAAAAVVAALAAELAAGAADCSRAQWDEAGGARAQAQVLRRRAVSLAERDATAYAAARRALGERGHATSGDDGTVRDRQLGVTLEQAADPPLALAAAAADIAELAALIAARGAGDVRADAGIAAVLAAAAARAAARLVQINLVAGGDRRRTERAREHAEAAAAAAAAALAGDI